MRFERLELLKFGALEEVSIDLSRGAPGLQVIYGDNEAGKTTVRRAITALLFGIPERTTDNFRFDNKALRLGATLKLGDGSVVSFRRKKARKSDVLDLQEKPLRVDWLDALARELGLERFESEWSLDHAQLRAGGRELAEGRGRVGESLLSAGLGGLPVSKLLEALGAEAGELFRPNAQAPKVNELLRRIGELRAELAERSILPRDVEEKERQLDALRKERKHFDFRRNEALRSLQRLERIERARPSLVRRAALREQLAALSAVPRVGADFGARRIEATKAADDAAAAVAKADGDLEKLDETLAAIAVDEAALGAGAEIEALAARAQVFVAEREELHQLVQSASDAEGTLAADAQAVGLDATRLTELARGPWQRHDANVRAVGDGLAEALPAVERMEAEVRDCQRQVDALKAREGNLPPEEDVSVLERALSALIAEGPPDKRLAKARQQAERDEDEAARAFEGLSRWTKDRAAFEQAVLPSQDEIETHTEALAIVPDEAAVDEAKAELEKHRRELQRLEARGEVPTEAALEKARKRRDQGWKLVRQQLDGETPSAQAVSRFAGGEALPDAFEAAVIDADEVADGLRNDASRITKYEQLSERIDDAAQALKRAEQRLAQDSKTLARAEKAWRALWAPFELDPGSPKVMRTWLSAAGEARRKLRQAAESKRACSEVEAQLRALAAPVAAVLGRKAPALEAVSALVTEAEAKLKTAHAAAAERMQLGKALQDARRALSTREAQFEAARRRRDELVTAREALAATFGLPAEATLDELRLVNARVTELAQKLQQRDRDAQRRAALTSRTTAFEAAARELARRLGAVRVDDTAAEVLVHGMSARLSAAREADQSRRQTGALREQVLRAKEEASRRRAESEQALARLCEEAGTSAPAALVQVQEQNEQRRELERRLAECEDALCAQTTDAGIDALAEEVAALAADELPALRIAAEQENEEAETRHTQLTGDIAVLEEALRSIRGTDEAAEKNAELQSALARLRDHAEAWLRLKYAQALLGGAVERFREQHQSPVLRRAGELFSRLTLGAYPALETSGDDEEAVLQGIRVGPDGDREIVGTDQMSDGTRDQLFLALRIAVLEQELAAREPLPFIVDDILIQLSDNRAHAALEVLAELGQKTQVLLFTHHHRVAELAQGLRAPGVFVHALGTKPAALRDARVAG